MQHQDHVLEQRHIVPGGRHRPGRARGCHREAPPGRNSSPSSQAPKFRRFFRLFDMRLTKIDQFGVGGKASSLLRPRFGPGLDFSSLGKSFEISVYRTLLEFVGSSAHFTSAAGYLAFSLLFLAEWKIRSPRRPVLLARNSWGDERCVVDHGDPCSRPGFNDSGLHGSWAHDHVHHFIADCDSASDHRQGTARTVPAEL